MGWLYFFSTKSYVNTFGEPKTAKNFKEGGLDLALDIHMTFDEPYTFVSSSIVISAVNSILLTDLHCFNVLFY